jgi:protein-S-isoprenylcysteine O-methyltransferase Ste14
VNLFTGIVIGCWVVWALVWAVAARFASQTKQRQSSGARRIQIALYIVAVALMIGPSWLPQGPLAIRIVTGLGAAWVGVGLTVAGLAFAIWARFFLGRNWSGDVTLKEGHSLIDTGPYALARHPIYTGLLTAFLGAALLRGTIGAFLGVALYGVAFASKISTEERLLASEFGPTYEAYRKRVKALVPFVL